MSQYIDIQTFNWDAPPCPYYGTCGGCSLQHLSPKQHDAHKLNQLQDRLDHFGITTQPDPLIRLNPGQRRRVSFKIHKGKIGFYAPASHMLVPINHCVVLTPHLNNLLSLIPDIIPACPDLPEKFSLTALDADNGIDLVFEGVDIKKLGFDTLSVLGSLTQHAPIIRVRISEHTIAEKIIPAITYAQYHVPIGAGDFCQVTKATDSFFAGVLTTSKTELKQADLFCGRGTLSLPMLIAGSVDAYDLDSIATLTLKNIASRYKLLLNSTSRNLFKEPLSTDECNLYERITLNPPREGAIHQIRQLALSTVPYLIYVSCNPASFARDASILIKNGYILNKMIPFDQFIWSNHLEVIGFFEKTT